MNTTAHHAYVTAGLGYLQPIPQKPFQYMYPPPEGRPWQNYEYDQQHCRIHDARPLASLLDLETTGFELLDAPSDVNDFYDAEQVKSLYYAELQSIVLALTGGTHAAVFDHQVRHREEGRPTHGFGREHDATYPAAVGRVHNDYTEASGRRRLQRVLPECDQDYPFMILNFWRPLQHPVFDTPLAVCDARSFSAQNWVSADIIYPERTGEIYLGTHSKEHHWYYYPIMSPRELLVFKSYDSRLDHPVRMTPHCAFDDPNVPADTPPRRSIEARCLVVLE